MKTNSGRLAYLNISSTFIRFTLEEQPEFTGIAGTQADPFPKEFLLCCWGGTVRKAGQRNMKLVRLSLLLGHPGKPFTAEAVKVYEVSKENYKSWSAKLKLHVTRHR